MLVQHGRIKQNQKNYLPAKEVASLVGYTPDYVTRLAREQKVAAERRGRQWFVDADSVKLFLLEAEDKKRTRSTQIRDERFSERAKFHNQVVEEKIALAIHSTSYVAFLQTAIFGLCLFVSVNLIWFSIEENLHVERISDGVSSIGSTLKEQIIEPIPNALDQVAAFAFSADSHPDDAVYVAPAGTDTTDSHSPDFQGVILLDDEQVTDEKLHELRSSFSDEVRVEFDDRDTGVVTPVFRGNEGDSYRFLLVPIDQKSNE